MWGGSHPSSSSSTTNVDQLTPAVILDRHGGLGSGHALLDYGVQGLLLAQSSQLLSGKASLVEKGPDIYTQQAQEPWEE